jgi:predicted TIM-barrel fold metal-dependent hydrolase
MAGVIDYLAYYTSPEGVERFNKLHDEETMICKLSGVYKGGTPFAPPEETIARMDAAGVERVFFAKLMMFSYIFKRPLEACTTDELGEVVTKYPDRFSGYAAYDPFHISTSLEEIERGVKQYGFKGVFVHIYGFDIPLDSRQMYPLYAKCCELDIPVVMQVGYVLEGMPSEHGRPILLDRIALDFPKLNIIGSHTGYPWSEELISMVYKFENVYFGASAHMPRYWDPSVVKNINSRLRDKAIFGTNAIPWEMMLPQIEELGLKDESKAKLLRENAVKLFKL